MISILNKLVLLWCSHRKKSK